MIPMIGRLINVVILSGTVGYVLGSFLPFYVALPLSFYFGWNAPAMFLGYLEGK